MNNNFYRKENITIYGKTQSKIRNMINGQFASKNNEDNNLTDRNNNLLTTLLIISTSASLFFLYKSLIKNKKEKKYKEIKINNEEIMINRNYESLKKTA